MTLSIHQRELPDDSGYASDASVVERLRRRDVETFERLYKAYHQKLSRFIGNIVRRPELVEEIFDDTIMVLWNKPESFSGRSRLSTWVYAVAYRKARHALRRLDDPMDDAAVAEIADAGASPEGITDREMVKAALDRAIATLSESHRTVIDLTYVHGLGYQEIAVIMACPVDTVKTRMFYARRHLKQMLPGTKTDWI